MYEMVSRGRLYIIVGDVTNSEEHSILFLLLFLFLNQE